MRKKILLSLCSLLFCVAIFAQMSATGKVTDVKGASIAGASVLEKGTKNATITASDGSYKINVKNGAKLIISSIGFDNVEVSAGSGVKTQLFDDQKALTEVVVTGVGSATSKKKLAIEVASLSTKDAAKSVVGSVEQALMGKIAGAQVQFQSGTPGANASIILRGLNTLGSSQPLIMVDGIEVSDINGLDLGNVEKIEVVKGAAGGMLYGAQGGNGVIQIFTKKGSNNKKPEITILSQVSSGTVINSGKDIFAKNHSFQTDAQGYIIGSGARIQRDINGAWDAPDFLDANTDPYVKNNLPYKEQLFDHLQQAYTRAYTTNVTLGVSGGGEKSDYAFNLSRYDESNVMSNRYYRTSLGSNVGFELVKGLTFRNSLQMIFTNDDLLSGDADASIGATGTGRFSLFNTFPYIDFTYKNPNGNTVVSANGGDKTTRNVLSEPEWRSRVTSRTRIIENANFNYKISKNFELDYKYGIEFNTLDRTNYYKNQVNAPQSATTFWGQAKKGSIRNDYSKNTRQNSLATLFIRADFDRDFGINFPLKTITQVAYDYRKYETRSFYSQGSELPAYPPYNISVANIKTSGDLYSTFVTYGVLLNQSFDYKELLGVSFGLRSDYSSVFGQGSKSQNFSRGTVYFRPTELIKIPYVSEWKIRAAYGGGGIQPDIYANQSTLGVSQLGNGSVLSSLSTLNNPALGVQESFETEIGSDFTFKTNNSKWFTNINVGITYWNHDSKAVIQTGSLPLTTGAAGLIDNLSTINATGVDLSIDVSVLRSKNLDWEFMGRLGTTKSKMVTIANGADIVDGLYTLRAGEEIGLLNYQSPLTSITQMNGATKTTYLSATQQSNAQLVNGLVVDTASKRAYIGAQNDPKTVGSFYPKFTASITNSFTILKKFTVSFQLDIVSGNKIYNLSRQWLYRDRLSGDFDKAITVNGQTGAYVNFYNSLYNNVSPSTWFVEDGSFVRLRDLSISYQLPSSIKFLKNASFTLSARNILTFTNYSGQDPEATSTADAQGNQASERGVGAIKGVDYFGVPNLKSFQATLRVGL